MKAGVCFPGTALHLRALPTNAAGQLNVLGHDGDALRVDGTQVGVLEQADKVSLRSLLESQDSRALEAQIGLEVLRNLAHQALERQLADEQLRALLVATNLTQRDGSGAVAVRLLHTSRRRRALTSSLGGELLARRLATG